MSALTSIASPRVRRGDLLVVPLGATEQHGPHLPLGTDSAIATALAQRLADTRHDVTVAPALAYGSSGEHQAFPGTISIGADALRSVIVELVRSATETFPRVLLLNAHGGNVTALTGAVDRLRFEGRDVRAWSPAAAFAGDAHAGHVETSVMLALAPRTVAMEHAAAGNRAPVAELLAPMRTGGVDAVSVNGVLGDPTAASAEDGETLLARGAAALCAFVEAWAA